MDAQNIFENYQVALFLAVLVIGWFFIGVFGRQTNKPREYPYVKAGALLTKAEKIFYEALVIALPPGCVIAIKVRFGDIVNVKKGLDKKGALIARSKIQQKHIDFVLCRRESMAVVCCIELNDSSHAADDRVKRDQFVREACKAAGIPLLEVKAAGSYSVSDLKIKLVEVCLLGDTLSSQRLKVNQDSVSESH